jgi:hypothetical protein
MMILHEYVTGLREEDQIETWAALAEVRKKYKVVDFDLANSNEYSYDDFIASWWGKDDLINVEMDNVVGIKEIDSLVSCPEPYCSYLYPCDYVFGNGVPTDAFGATKINKLIQLKVPMESWYHKGVWKTLDARIKNNIVQVLPSDQIAIAVLRGMVWKIKGVPFAHNHNDVNHMLKHNHGNRVGEPDPYTHMVDKIQTVADEPQFNIQKGKLFEIKVMN